jgi:hypothetical protein
MKNYINLALSDKLIKRLLVISLVLIILTALFAILNYRKLPPLIPIFNQLPWGIDRLSNTWGIFIPILFSLLIFIFNFFAAGIVYNESPLLSRMLAITTFIATLLSLLFVFRTITLII